MLEEVVSKVLRPLSDDIDLTSLSQHLLFQTLASTHQLLNNDLPALKNVGCVSLLNHHLWPCPLAY